jgi:protein FRA10AC1
MSTFESKERQEKHQKKKRKVTASQPTVEDYAALRQHYTFLPRGNGAGTVSSSAAATTTTSSSNHGSSNNNSNTDAASTTWQSRMVARYHEHLDKDYVLANMTRAQSPHHQLGLRWRTKTEVQTGKGSKSCGNLHCPAALVATNKNKTTTTMTTAAPSTAAYKAREHYLQKEEEETEAREVDRLAKLAPGILLTDYIVPFTYREHGEIKTQLVKLKLCAKCAPLLFLSQGNTTDPSLAARRARRNQTATSSSSNGGNETINNNSNNTS